MLGEVFIFQLFSKGGKFMMFFRFSTWNLFKVKKKHGWLEDPPFFQQEIYLQMLDLPLPCWFSGVHLGLWKSRHLLFMVKKVMNLSSKFLGAFCN